MGKERKTGKINGKVVCFNHLKAKYQIYFKVMFEKICKNIIKLKIKINASVCPNKV